MTATIYVLLIVTIKGSLVQQTIQPEVVLFTSAERCLKNIPLVQKQLEAKYDEVHVQCIARDLMKGQ